MVVLARSRGVCVFSFANVKGQVVWRQELRDAGINAVIDLPSEELPAGLYFVLARGAEINFSEKLIIQR